MEITAGRKTFGGPLIEGFERDEATGEHVLYLSPRAGRTVRGRRLHPHRLGNPPESGHGPGQMAARLHRQPPGHARDPHRLGLERLRTLCGSEPEQELWLNSGDRSGTRCESCKPPAW
ncbi:MAG: hypothetical protein MZV65_15630 [Chromatiales bacterium]|nr:hypothetical protein [Chromatiales bacterium]